MEYNKYKDINDNSNIQTADYILQAVITINHFKIYEE